MRPLTLTFKGLRSYRQPATIDFADLDLFAIIGDTGAGKSTVIEALSLALYGRKTWTGGSNLEDLIADGENTMAIELRFRADGNDWTVTRSRHRNAAAPVNKLECVALGEKVDGAKAVNDRIETLLGLDHQQFVRAVVLPQGRFDELLQSTKTERNKILRSIFGLDDLRRVRDDATRRREHWQPVIAEAEARRSVLPIDPVAARAEAVARRDELHGRLVALQQAQVEAVAHSAEIACRHDEARRLADVAARLGSPVDLDGLDALIGRAEALMVERDALSAARAQAEAEREAAHAAQTAALAGFADRSAAAGAVSLLGSVAANLTELDDEATTTDAVVAQLMASTPVAIESPELIQAEAEADVALAAAAQTREAARTLVAADDRVVTARRAQAEAQMLADEARTEAALAGAALTTAQHQLALARAAQIQATQTGAAAVAARGCVPGDACPVCARSLPADFVAPEAGDVVAADTLVQQAETDVSAAARQLAVAETTMTHRVEALAAAQTELESALMAVGHARATLGPQAVDMASDEVLRRTEQIWTEAEARQRQAVEARQRAAAEREAAIAAHGAELRNATMARDALRRRRQAQEAQLAGIPPHWAPDEMTAAGATAAAARIDTMVRQVIELESRASDAEAALATATTRFADLRTDAIEQVSQPVGELARRIAEQLSLDDESPDGSGTLEVPNPLLLDHVAELAEAMQRGAAQVAGLSARIEARSVEVGRELSRLTLELDRHLGAVGVTDAAELATAAGATRVEHDQAVEAVETLEAAVVDAARLDGLLGVGRRYLANLGLLIQSLRDQHFVDALVSAREVELLAEATRRLRAISGDRYGFVPDFGVVRIATGEIRSPDTLSGGERFQAALALALALVEIASRGAGKLDAVFVDEGFGSLDAGALDVALDTLGSVAGGGKMVALISHLRPVAEYVDTVFNVTKDDLFGSTITKLDAEAREQLLADDIRSGLTG